MKSKKAILIVSAAAVLAVIALVAVLLLRKSNSSNQVVSSPSYFDETTHVFETANSPALGSEDAPAEIVVFSDYNCAMCRGFHTELLRLQADYPQKLRIVFKFLPADPLCNPYVPADRESTSCYAAAAAHAAHLQGVFFPYNELLYEHFGEHAPQDLVTHAERAGVEDIDAFIDVILNAATYEFLAAESVEAVAAGATGTPTVFLNGRRLLFDRLNLGQSPYGVLREAIDLLSDS